MSKKTSQETTKDKMSRGTVIEDLVSWMVGEVEAQAAPAARAVPEPAPAASAVPESAAEPRCKYCPLHCPSRSPEGGGGDGSSPSSSSSGEEEDVRDRGGRGGAGAIRQEAL